MRFNQDDIGPRLPEGEYLARVSRVVERESSNGNPMVVVDLTVEHAGYSGERIRDFFVVDAENPRAAQIGRRRLASLCSRTGLDVMPALDLDLQELIGRIVLVVIREDTLDGLPVVRVRSYRKPPQHEPF